MHEAPCQLILVSSLSIVLFTAETFAGDEPDDARLSQGTLREFKKPHSPNGAATESVTP